MLKLMNLFRARWAVSSPFLGRMRQVNAMSSRTAIILDFDGTITTKDTISALFKFALSTQQSRGKDLSAAYDVILAKYGEDYAKHVKEYFPPKEQRRNLSQEIEYCGSLKDVETRSFERVSRSGLFRGISPLQWRVFGRDAVKNGEVVIREGFSDFITNVERSEAAWGVVSVNFSRDFIRGVLESAGVKTFKVQILANTSDENGILIGPESREGENTPVMTTSDAKLAAMKNLLWSWKEGQGTALSKVIYIGDSGTDIECLTEEGTTGIVMAQDRNSSLIETIKRLGLAIEHINNYNDGNQSNIYWAQDFRGIAETSSLMSQRISEKS